MNKILLLGIISFILGTAVYSCCADKSVEFWGLMFYIFSHYLPVLCLSLVGVVFSENKFITTISKASLSYCISCILIIVVFFILGKYNEAFYNPAIGRLAVIIFLITMLPSCLTKRRVKK